MDSGKEQQQIEQLKNLKRQLRWWKTGIFCTGVFVVVASVGTVNSSVRGLIEKGPKQDRFLKEMTASFKNDIAPLVEDMARDTVNEVRPQIQASFERVNARLPELAQASLQEMDTLQANLPKRGEAVLRKSFGDMLVKKEDELKAMFPEATDEQITRLLTNLGESASAEATNAAVELFGSHHASLERIHKNLELMSAKEKNLEDVDPSWEMGLLVLDLFRADLEELRPGKDVLMAESTSIKAAQSTTKSATKETATKSKSSSKSTKNKQVKLETAKVKK